MLFSFFSPFILATFALGAPQVKLGQTTLVGRDVTLFKQDFFGGIPFAEPPLGNLRLKPPVLKTRLSQSTFDASNFGLACFQSGVPSALLSEDCLTINVFRPSGISRNASLPVLFWTYGGGFDAGAAAIYNGSAIVAQSVARGTPLIYVNFNYRLGPLGFPQGQEAADRGALNLALKDQLTALEWVQENICEFGGDKTKVTVFGESAGAIMTAILFLNSPLDRLARAAIFESGSAGTALSFKADHREIDWQNFVGGVPQCASLATSGETFDCLKTANSSAILQGLLASLAEAPEAFGFDPTIDGPGGLFPDIPSKLFAKGHFARLPFIAGTNLDEGTAFTPASLNSEALIRQSIIANFSPPLVPQSELESAADRLLQLYPDIPALGSPFNTGNETFGLNSNFKRAAALQGDLSFQSQRRLWIQTASNAGVKTFGYLFTELLPGSGAAGVPHGSEVTFVYGQPPNPAPSAVKLSSVMIDYWVSFATSLDPNDGHGNPRPNWAQYTPTNQVLMQLNGLNTTLIPDNYRAEQIAFINSDPAVFHHRRSLSPPILATPALGAPQVKLGQTTLVGRDVTLLKQDFFGGIPFAEPPLGNLRLKPPVLKTRLSQSTFDASNFGLACFQSGVPSALLSEDCLTINIFRPSGISRNASLPVLFWTYGGGFQAGASATFNGSAIVAQSVARGTPLIYVNFNYRLGPLGFPQGQEAANRGALNLALKDQLTALEWVQENIREFGGDKTKVTVFGESAGAIMTAILFLNSPLDKLARAAILESGSPGTSLSFKADHREIDWQNFVGGVPGCASLATSGKTFDCLKTANSSAILQGLLASLAEAPEEFAFDPTFDGPGGLFPDIPSRLFAKGHFARLPFIAGTNLDEGTIFTPSSLNSEALIRQFIIANFSPPIGPPSQLDSAADRLLQLYPDIPALGSPFNTGNETFGLNSNFKRAAALEGDLVFQSQRRSWIQAASNAGVKTFGYLFTEAQPGSGANGVFHSAEIAFVYGQPPNPAPSAVKLSSVMIDYWVSFATSLDPNDGHGNPRPNWPQYTPKNQVLLQLNGANTTLIPDNYRAEQIAFINSDPAIFHHRHSL